MELKSWSTCPITISTSTSFWVRHWLQILFRSGRVHRLFVIMQQLYVYHINHTFPTMHYSFSRSVGPPLLIPVYFNMHILQTMYLQRDWVVNCHGNTLHYELCNQHYVCTRQLPLSCARYNVLFLFCVFFFFWGFCMVRVLLRTLPHVLCSLLRNSGIFGACNVCKVRPRKSFTYPLLF